MVVRAPSDAVVRRNGEVRVTAGGTYAGDMIEMANKTRQRYQQKDGTNVGIYCIR